MSGKPIKMSKIRQILQLYEQDFSIRKINQTLRIDRQCITQYIDKYKSLNRPMSELMALEDPELENLFISGKVTAPDNRFDYIKNRLPYYIKELSRDHMTKQLLWQEYKRQQPEGYGYSQFCFYLQQFEMAQVTPQKTTAILIHIPGNEMQIDFSGKKMHYTDRLTGEIITVETFVATLPFSNYGFAICVPTQNSTDFLFAMKNCLQFFGGVPKIFVPDNLKSAVKKSDRYEPDINRMFEDFATHYGAVVCPARVRKPTDKGPVEFNVHLFYERLYAPLRDVVFFSLEELNEAILELVIQHNQRRFTRKPFTREELFLAQEKECLRELPATDFEVKSYCELTISDNCCIYLSRDKHHYSVPYIHVGKKAKVIYSSTLVSIYVSGDCVAKHVRSHKTGYTTKAEHMASNNGYVTGRSALFFIEKAKKLSSPMGALVQQMFDNAVAAELVYKRCEGLFRLQRSTDPDVFNKACQIALNNKILTYNFINNLITNNCVDAQNKNNYQPLPTHENIRGKEAFN